MDISQIYSTQDIMNLLTNKAFQFAKTHGLVDNLMAYQTFNSSQEYFEKIFPLLQNEQFHSLDRDRQRYFKELTEQQSFPLVFKVIINEDHDYYENRSIRLDFINESESMPNIERDQEDLWKYKHYADYLRFKEMTNCIVGIYLQNERTYKVFSTLGYFQKSREEKFIEIPLAGESFQIVNIRNINTYYQQLEQYRQMRIVQLNSRNRLNQCNDNWDQVFYIYVQPLGSTGMYKNEAQALLHIENCQFYNLLLEPTSQNNEVEPTNFSERVLLSQHQYFQNQDYTENFNDDQIDAIQDALSFEKKITIIKGPPGTGKTQTTLGIINIMAEPLKKSGNNEKGVILVLAKSNSVVNDLVRKLKESPVIICPHKLLNVVRIGRAELCDQDIQGNSLEIMSQIDFFHFLRNEVLDIENQFINQRLKQRLTALNIINHQYDLVGEIDGQFSLIFLLQQIEQANTRTLNQTLLNALGNYYQAITRLFKNRRTEYDEIEQANLKKYNIIVSTLNSCAHECLIQYMHTVQLRMCIVDEAPTALEPSLLIPFVKYPNLGKVVLLGDTRQLNPITIAVESKDYTFSRSMFERLAKGLRNSSFRLRYQYRQMPNLAEITSVMFYNGRLLNGILNMQFPIYLSPKVSENKNRLFFNTPTLTEQEEETSRINDLECKAIMELVKYLLNQNQGLEKKITIISAYNAQKENIRRCLVSRNLTNTVELDTVDSFQGKENDVIILSLVRSNQQTGFLKDKKRTNVALSRAKYCQFIFGTKQTMNTNFRNWRSIIRLMEERHEIINYTENNLQNPQFFRSKLFVEQQPQQ